MQLENIMENLLVQPCSQPLPLQGGQAAFSSGAQKAEPPRPAFPGGAWERKKGCRIICPLIVPDDRKAIVAVIRAMIDNGGELIVTTADRTDF